MKNIGWRVVFDTRNNTIECFGFDGSKQVPYGPLSPDASGAAYLADVLSAANKNNMRLVSTIERNSELLLFFVQD